MSILLKIEERIKTTDMALKEHYRLVEEKRRVPNDYMLMFTEGGEGDAIAYANCRVQLKKVGEWGEEDCYDHNGAQRREHGWHVKRRECLICWEALLKEIEVSSDLEL